MKLIDADELRVRLVFEFHEATEVGGHADAMGLDAACAILDAAPSVDCAADNPHGLVPSKCPMCGESLVPYPCIDMATDSYRAGILYGQQHPEWRAGG